MAYSEDNRDKIFDLVLERIENGEPLRVILRDEDMPSSRTFYKWLQEDPLKVKLYEDSTTLRSEALFDKMFEIATNPEMGETTKTLANGGLEVTTGDMIAHRRLQIDVIKWGLSKLNPKKYGDKIDMTTQGEKIGESSPEEKAFRLAEILKKVNTK